MNTQYSEKSKSANPASWKFALPPYIDVWVHSDEFNLENTNNATRFSIWLRDTSREIGTYSIDVSVRKMDTAPIKADITIWLDIGDGKKLTKKLDDWIEACTFPKVMQGKYFKDEFTINCEIVYYEALDNRKSSPPSLNINENLAPFCLSSSLSDVKIIIDGEELPAHKLVLGAHSPVFLNMFETPMREAAENQIFIEGITADTMRIVLHVLYTGNKETLSNSEVVLNVLVVADRYDMQKLKAVCEYKLLKMITTENVLKIYDHADTYNAKTVQAKCRKFIIQHRQEIVTGENLRTLCIMKPNLMYDIMRRVMAD